MEKWEIAKVGMPEHYTKRIAIYNGGNIKSENFICGMSIYSKKDIENAELIISAVNACKEVAESFNTTPEKVVPLINEAFLIVLALSKSSYMDEFIEEDINTLLSKLNGGE